MPRLPTSADIQRRIPTPSGGIVSYTPDQSGASDVEMGSAIQRLGGAIDEYANKIDKVNANEALLELRKARDEITLGTEGYTKILGGDTQKKQIVKTYPEMYQARRDEIAGKLSTPRARQYFLETSAPDVATFNANVLKHAAAQTEAHAKAVFEQSIKQNVNAAALDWNNIDSVEARKMESARNIRERYAEFGMSDLADSAIKANNAKIDATIINAALQNNDVEHAQRVFEAGKDNFDAATLSRVQTAIKGHKDLIEVNDTAASEVTRTISEYRATEVERPLKEVNDEIAKRFPNDPTKQRQTLQEYRTQLSIEKTLIDQEKQQEKTWLYDKLYTGNGRGIQDPEVRSVIAVLPEGERNKIIAYNQKMADPARETNWGVYADVKERIYRGDKTLNILEYADRLSASDTDQLITLQNGDAVTIHEAQTLDNQVAATIETLKIPTSEDAQFKNLVRAAIDAEYPDKKPDAKQRQAVIDRMVIQYRKDIPFWFMDMTRKRYQLTPEQAASGEFKADIPAAARTRITMDISRRFGIPVEAIPEDQLVKIWIAKGKPQE